MVNKAPARQETQRCGFNPWVKRVPWRRKSQPTPVFLPRKSHGQRACPWGCKRVGHKWVTKQYSNQRDFVKAHGRECHYSANKPTMLPHFSQGKTPGLYNEIQVPWPPWLDLCPTLILLHSLLTPSFESQYPPHRLIAVRMDGITDSMDMSLSKLQELVNTGRPGVLQSMGSQGQTRLSNWTVLLTRLFLLEDACTCCFHTWNSLLLDHHKVYSLASLGLYSIVTSVKHFQPILHKIMLITLFFPLASFSHCPIQINIPSSSPWFILTFFSDLFIVLFLKNR